LKIRAGNMVSVIILTAVMAFLAVDIGFYLYNPDRLASSPSFCVLDAISGEILVLKKDSLSWEKAGDGTILEPGSRVKTSPGAQAVLTFTRGTTTKLEPGTDVIIDKIEESQGTQPYSVCLKQQSGKTWNQVDKTGGNTSFQIRTQSADVKVHGTLFATEIDASGKTTVQTTEGRVSVSAGGAEVQVAAGEQTEVEPHARPSIPAAIPPAANELVITVNQSAYALVQDPAGSSAGYLNYGVTVNQISGAYVAMGGSSGQTIRLREPEMGEYTLSLRGLTDGTSQVSVEGFIGGKSAFLHVESCNITAAGETLLKLHYDVLAGLLQHPVEPDSGSLVSKAALASELPDESNSEVSKKNTPPESSDRQASARKAVTEKDDTADNGQTWFGSGKYSQLIRWGTVGCFLFLIGIIFVMVRRNT
jgi:hypothetical protein